MTPPASQSIPASASGRPKEDDPFRYGWRYVKRELPDGRIEFDQVPLTLEDVLHPEEEDFIITSTQHEMECGYLTGVFRSRPLGPPIVRVTSDLRIDWEVEGLRPHGPDVAVFVGMREPPRLRDGTMYVKAAGGRCLLVVEIVSPSTRVNDVTSKVEHYHRAGVPLYVIVDEDGEDGPRSIVAYRWTPKQYERQPLDAQGRLLLEPLGLHLSLRDDRVVCHDAETGREIGDHARALNDLDEADRRHHEQTAAIEEAVEARRLAERQARVEKEAKEAALRQAREERQAREALEERLRRMEAMLRERGGADLDG